MLSNHYDNPKIREKNAGLLCKRSHLSNFDHPPFLEWVLYWLFICVILCAVYKPVLPIVDKVKILKNICGCGLHTGVLNRSKFTVVCYNSVQIWLFAYIQTSCDDQIQALRVFLAPQMQMMNSKTWNSIVWLQLMSIHQKMGHSIPRVAVANLSQECINFSHKWFNDAYGEVSVIVTFFKSVS